MAKRTRQVIAATMIVKDEEAVLARCLTSLRGIVDEIHVHDTGSTDATPEIAAEFGAQVTHGPWTGNFAAARNAALEGWTADWALVVDADDEIVADAAALREFLATTRAGVISAEVLNIREGGVDSAFPSGRVFRPRWAHWAGKVHEQLTGRTKPLRVEAVPSHVLHVRHSGYASVEMFLAKCERNLAIAQAEVDAMAAQGSDADPEKVAGVLVDLGRSHMGLGRLQDAVDTFETVRELFPGTPAWLRATDLLACMLCDAGIPDAALVLAQQLRDAGADDQYCDWLTGRAFTLLGASKSARRMLAGVTEVVDTAGFRVELSAPQAA
jgi:hypothetical protein